MERIKEWLWSGLGFVFMLVGAVFYFAIWGACLLLALMLGGWLLRAVGIL